eukprot:g2323.t1
MGNECCGCLGRRRNSSSWDNSVAPISRKGAVSTLKESSVKKKKKKTAAEAEKVTRSKKKKGRSKQIVNRKKHEVYYSPKEMSSTITTTVQKNAEKRGHVEKKKREVPEKMSGGNKRSRFPKEKKDPIERKIVETSTKEKRDTTSRNISSSSSSSASKKLAKRTNNSLSKQETSTHSAKSTKKELVSKHSAQSTKKEQLVFKKQTEGKTRGDRTGSVGRIVEYPYDGGVPIQIPTKKPKILLEWCKWITTGFKIKGAKVYSWKSKSWTSGLAFVAMVAKALPDDMIDYDKIEIGTPLERLQLAFHLAETELGVEKVLDAQKDIVDYGDTPIEPMSLKLYLSLLQPAIDKRLYENAL